MSEDGESATRSRRRRANATAGPRRHRVVIAHNDDELAMVKAMAAVQGISPQRLYVRALTTGGTEAAAKMQRVRDELSATRRLLAAVSNNVNQIAVAANATGEMKDELTMTLHAVRRVALRLDGVLSSVEEESA